MDATARPRSLADSPLIPLVVFLLGMALIVAPSVTQGFMPGDLGDARFNNYVLEHFYRRLIGLDLHFWSADFFYPFPLVITFSDNHLGTGLAYSAARMAGLGREDAYRTWLVFAYGSTFVTCAYALHRLGYTRLAASLGAWLFAFGMPITEQEGHAQLICRFAIPLAVLALVRFGRDLRPRQLILAGFWTVWQFYISIYTGYFLALLIVAIGLAVIRFWRDGVARIREEWRGGISRWLSSPAQCLPG